jgi:lipoyl(octanoyl) transferase
MLRIIDDGPRTAAFNMAADMYLLDACKDQETVFVRFYEWSPPAISLGCMQIAEDVLDIAACRKAGIEWIRRPTGGRAVLHFEDITYSCVFSKKIRRMGASISQTYRLISACLASGLAASGIDCSTHDSTLDARKARREAKLPCFLAPNRDEIMVGGKKLAGSAQKRTADAVLQHGSIPLSPAFRQLPLYEKISPAERDAQTRLLNNKCTCIQEILGTAHADKKKILANLKAGFAATFAMTAEEKGWNEEERAAIKAIIEKG